MKRGDPEFRITETIDPCFGSHRSHRSHLTNWKKATVMKKDRIKWNGKHRENPEKEEPSRILTEFHAMAKTGRALDIACGTGRNALFLAERGFQVDALDISEVGLRMAKGKHERIRPACVDLDHYEIAAGRYDLIVNVRYLNRRLFPYIKEGLAPGGVLVFESFMERQNPVKTGAAANEENGWNPSCRDYLFRENELLHAFLSLKIRYYRESEAGEPRAPQWLASLVAVKE